MTLREMTKRRRRAAAGKLPPRPKPVEGKAEGEPERAGERLRRLVAAERWHEALKLAASFALLPEPDKTTIQRAWQAKSRPDFVRQLGGDTAALVEAGTAALWRRFGPKETR